MDTTATGGVTEPSEAQPDGRTQDKPSEPLTATDPAVDVTIVLPCLNEVATLPHCIRNAGNALRQLAMDGLSGEILIADNGSTDGSQALARDLGARVVPVAQRGYGSALRGGIAAAHGRYIVMGDCDGSYDFEESVPMVRRLLEGYELCMGSRLRGRIMPGAMPWKNRHIGNPVLTGILNLLFRSGLSDAHCGLRAFTRDAAQRLNLTSEGMEFASEMVIKAALIGLKRTEVPITLHPDLRNRPPHLRPWRDGWRHLRYLFMLSPTGLFHVPAAVLGSLGVLIFALLLLKPGSEVVHVGPLWMGDHWVILASGMLALAHQLWLLGLATTLHGVQSGYRKLPTSGFASYRRIRLENMLVAGLLLIGIGAAAFLWISISWSLDGFGPLDRLREVAFSTTLIVIGLQNVFGGFIISIVCGNHAEIVPASAPEQGAVEAPRLMPEAANQ